MPRHKHADVIIAWANGAQIQCKSEIDKSWEDFKDSPPRWLDCCEYRIKPEPKPDVVRYGLATHIEIWPYGDINKMKCPNLRLTFDGETGNLKRVEIVE